MLKNDELNKSYDFLNEDYRLKMNNYFNPYEYSLENYKKKENGDIIASKSKNHIDRKKYKKS